VIGICARFIFGRANYRYFHAFEASNQSILAAEAKSIYQLSSKYPVSSTVVKKAASGFSRQAGYDTLV
jgi:hypothetical protein